MKKLALLVRGRVLPLIGLHDWRAIVQRGKLAKGLDQEFVPESNRARLPSALYDHLHELSRLPDNWDSYGALPISPQVIERATSTLREILAFPEKGISLPFVAPACDGTIGMQWNAESGKELILDIPPCDQPLSFLLVEPVEGNGEVEIEDVLDEKWTLEMVIQRLLARYWFLYSG